MTATDTEFVLDESLDFEPACEYQGHSVYSPADAAAEWIVWVLPTPCECFPLRARLVCTPCKEIVCDERGGRRFRCTSCGLAYEKQGTVLSAERL
jgi:hypothetical protein